MEVPLPLSRSPLPPPKVKFFIYGAIFLKFETKHFQIQIFIITQNITKNYMNFYIIFSFVYQ